MNKEESSQTPVELPAAYELIEINEITSLRREAIRQGSAGTAEGTLIWAQHQREANGRLVDGQPKVWFCGEGDLHCAIVLRPEFPKEHFHEVLVVAAVALGNAIAAHLSPMIALAFGWPNKLLIANHKIAGLWVDADPIDSQWMTITCSVNIKNAPDDFTLAAMSIGDAEGGTELTANQLLETYAREFINLINKWDERGFDVMLKQWVGRMNDLDKAGTYCVDEHIYSGRCVSINGKGDCCLEKEGGETQCISIREYMGL